MNSGIGKSILSSKVGNFDANGYKEWRKAKGAKQIHANPWFLLEAASGFEPENNGFAV